ELAPQRAHFVLEEIAERFHELQMLPLRQATDIVMRLDRHRRPAKRGDALDDVGIERSLRQELGVANGFGLTLEDVDERRADDLALLLGVFDAVEALQEEIARIGMNERNIVVAAEQRHDFFRFAFAHQASVDKDAGELVDDGLVYQQRSDRRIDAARQPADDAALANALADTADGLGTKRFHVPIRRDARDGLGEIAQQRG